MISCSDMTVSSGYTYDPYPYSSYYHYYHNPYYYYRVPYRPVYLYRERIIVVPQRRNNKNRTFENNRRFGNGRIFGNGNFQFGQGQRNNSSTTGHFGNGRR